MLFSQDRDLDVPGTELLVDTQHDLDVAHDGSDIILLPHPTACEGDPLNWSRWKKYWHLLLISIYACVFSFGENNTGDAYTTIVEMTGSTMTIMNGGGALNYLLLGLVNIFWVPTAMKIGRRFCFLATLLLCIGSSLWMGAFHTAGEWFGSNILNGLGTSAYEAVIQLVVFDLFFDHQRGSMLGVYIFAQQLGSIIGLVAGGYISDGPGWRWAQWVVSIAEGVLIVAFFFTFEETLFPRFLFTSSQTLSTNKATTLAQSDAALEDEIATMKDKGPVIADTVSVEEGTAMNTPAPSQFPKRTFREKLRLWVYYPQDHTSYWTYFKRPFFLLKFPNIVIAGVIFAFGCTSGIVTNNTISETLSAPPYNFTDGQTGLVYISALVGSVIGYFTSVFGDKIVIYLARRNDGIKEPEMRLWALVPCFFYAGLGYEIYGWGAETGSHWITIAVGIGSMIAQQVAATSTSYVPLYYLLQNCPGLQDNTIVGTATPTLTNEFHSLTDIGWYGSAYRLTTCSTQFLFGKLYEQFRVKWVLVMAVAILEIGSIVSASASSSAAFIVGRAIAGCGSSGILNGVLIAISHTVPLRWRPICNSTVGGLECIAMIVAPVIGGALTTYVIWRWCFWLNLPVGGFTMIVIIFLFKNPESQKVTDEPFFTKIKQLNIMSLLIFTGSVVCLLLALQWGGTTYSWSSGRVIAPLVVAAVSFAGFIAFEVLQKDAATIPRSVILNRTTGLCLVYAFCSSAAFNVIDYFLPIWFQAIKGATAAKSGQMLLPSIIGLSVAAISSGFIVSAIGYYTPLMLLGSTMMAIGFGFLTSFTPRTTDSAWIGWQVMFSIGIGLAFPQPWSATQTALDAKDIPVGMAAVGFSISIGAAISISVSQNIFTNLLREGLSSVPGLDVGNVIEQGATGFLNNVPASEKERVIDIYNSAVTRTFWAGVAAACVGLVAALCMKWNSVKGAKKERTVEE
ncbi:major facilitator superfamily domain-containing protein [Aspergillus flavus]|uniref:Major facilitator superfamily domain-containing protein n=1 Tax=Aspergillus flavus TaxID=5059 RepID=A0A5N6GT45_ASPFL|nr:major facilitator superfamily domain-containing protein [Aspergillus flavus]